MADDVEMIPVTGAEPPKADPLAKPVTDKPATIKLTPVARATAPGATPSPALKPGLKLPPKPGFGAGLKLPPKPGAAFKPGLKLPTQTAVKPGLKLPTQTALKPGLKLPTQTALKPGVKLPAKPVIRKPGATVATAPLPKPVTPPPVADLPKPMEALKTVTQKLKGITQEIPQQAVLHKTGIISEGSVSELQKAAAKHKTARISLSDAMGVAPVKDEAAPMKTIRIKRPISIPTPTPTAALTPQPKVDAAPAASETPAAADAKPASPAAPSADAKPASPAPTVTQRKTLKITRPGGVAVRPRGKFGVKRPASAAAAVPKQISEGAPADKAADAVADIADIPNMPAAPAPAAAAPAAVEGPAWLWTMSALLQFAACVAIGALAWFLWENTQLPTYCGGLGWGQ